MNRVLAVIHEMHRRSLWQVLGIYIAGAWIMLQAADTISSLLGLPEWAPKLALFLLIIGLPIVLATAVVQEGKGPLPLRPAHRRTRVPVTASDAGPAIHHRLFTWRNAVLGGMAAFALWGVVAAGYVVTGRGSLGSTADESLPMLAVLPFDNLGDASDTYFADGMADDVRSRLATVPRLRVIAHASAEQYRDTDKPPAQIARELGATHLLTGRVRWDRSSSGRNRVRVTPELVEVGGDGKATMKWQNTFDAVLEDVFRVQSEIATQVSQALDVLFRAGDRDRLAAQPTENLEAYDAYLRGREIQRTTSTGDVQALRRAAAHYERAVALDPDFAHSWAELSRTLSTIYNNGTQDPELGARARGGPAGARARARPGTSPRRTRRVLHKR